MSAASTLTTTGTALTDLILPLFRLNSRLVMMGDRLVAGLGLTSARWQVLGAIVAGEHPRPVAWIARDLGGNRQNVQRIVNDLHKEGLIDFEPNPHHKRAQLVVLTAKGRAVYDQAMERWTPWANSLAEGHTAEEIAVMGTVVREMHRRLEAAESDDA